MTTRELLIAAKGEINTANDPNASPDTAQEMNFYTILSHPDPQDDPLPSAEIFKRGDSNFDGSTDISDASYTLNFLFLGGPEPPAPGVGSCGADPTADGLDTCNDNDEPFDEC